MNLARPALQFLLSLCTLCSLSQAFAHNCDSLIAGNSGTTYLNLIAYAIDHGALPTTEFKRLSELDVPVNPMKANVLASQANLTRALAIAVEKMTSEEWTAAREGLAARANKQSLDDVREASAKESTVNVFAMRSLTHRPGLERVGEIRATRDGRLVATASLGGHLGLYSLLDDQFLSVASDHLLTSNDLFETKSGKLLLAAVTSTWLHVFDVTHKAATPILERDLKEVPQLKEMLAVHGLRVYEPMLFEAGAGVHVFLHAKAGATHLRNSRGRAVLPVATISLASGRSSGEMLSPMISRFNREGNHIFASGWLKDWTESDGKSVLLVARDVSHKVDVVAGEKNAYQSFPSVNDPTVSVLPNRTVAILPDTGYATIYDPKMKVLTKIEKEERFNLNTMKFFVHDGKSWFAALALNDVVHSEARLVYGPAEGKAATIVRIPMRALSNQVDRFERLEVDGKTYFLICEVNDRQYVRMHIYDETDRHLTSLDFPVSVEVGRSIYRKTEVLRDGRWIASFTDVNHDHPVFVQLRGPVRAD